MGKGRFGGDRIGPNPTDRAKPGTKTSLVTDGRGGPLGVVIDGANIPDQKLLHDAPDAIVTERPDPETEPQNLCLDKGYDNPPAVRPSRRTNTSGTSAHRRGEGRPARARSATSRGDGW